MVFYKVVMPLTDNTARQKYLKEYNKKNRLKINKRNRANRLKNRDAVNKKAKEYYYKNKDHILELHKNTRDKDPEKFRLRRSKYVEEHRDDINKKQRENYWANRDDILEARRKWGKDNPEKASITRKKSYKKFRKQRLKYMVEYAKLYPEVGLKSKKKELTNLGKIFDLDCHAMRYAWRSWSKTVRKRDNDKCRHCNSTENLIAHHIWHKAFCPESSLDVDNGITLCHECHKEQHRLDKSFN
tara:strand:+ start:390 stop:1115 length:726 start_codon:yes stop_codon:yes gene_type:complete